MKRYLTLLAAALLLLSVGAGMWRRSTDTAANAEAQQVLRVALWDYGTVSYDQKIIERFQQTHPEIRIEVISCPPAYYDDSLKAMLDSGERVDVIYANQLSQYAALVDRGVAMPLDALVARDGIDLSAYAGIDALRDPSDGALMGLPYRQDQFLLYYNRDLFDRAGVPYPQKGMTWAQFRETARTLTTRLKAEDEALWGAYFLKKEKHMFYYMDSRPFDWENDAFSRAARGLELLLAMEQDGSIPRFAACESRQDSQRMFETGKYAMFVHGSWYLNFLATDQTAGLLDFRWSAAERPVWSAEEPSRDEIWLTPLCISAGTTEPEAAWTFVKYVCGEQSARVLAAEMMPPAYHSAQAQAVLQQGLEARGLDPALLQSTLSVPEQLLSAREQALADAVYAQYGRALLGLDTVDESVAQMEAARSAAAE